MKSEAEDGRRKKLACDFRKTFDSIRHIWIPETIAMNKVGIIIMKFIKHSIKHYHTLLQFQTLD